MCPSPPLQRRNGTHGPQAAPGGGWPITATTLPETGDDSQSKGLRPLPAVDSEVGMADLAAPSQLELVTSRPGRVPGPAAESPNR